MVVTVKIPTQLRSITGGDAEDAATVGEVLDGFYERFEAVASAQATCSASAIRREPRKGADDA